MIEGIEEKERGVEKGGKGDNRRMMRGTGTKEVE